MLSVTDTLPLTSPQTSARKTLSKIIRNVLRFVSLLPLGADNLCKLEWSYIDFEKAILTIPCSEMKVKDKNKSDFILPLPHQALSIFKEIQEITGWGVWVFHGISQPLPHVGLESANKALRGMGFNDEVNRGVNKHFIALGVLIAHLVRRM